jgi:hypothetical protein
MKPDLDDSVPHGNIHVPAVVYVDFLNECGYVPVEDVEVPVVRSSA